MKLILGKENLKREIGVMALTLAILNVTVGTGIFVIPALVAEELGATAILAYLVCGALIVLIALCFTEVGSKTKESGGVYTYIETAFGPYAGFIANNLYWFGAGVLSDAALSNALADMMKYYFPFLGMEVFRVLFFIVIFGALALLNIRSLKGGVRFVEFATFGKLIPLLIVVAAGTGFISSKNLVWVSFPSLGHIGSASLLLFYAFMGFETPLSNGGEIKNARRTVPLGILFGVSLVLLLYISIQWVTQGVLGGTMEAHKNAPLAAVAEIVFGKTGMVFILIATAISMLGGLAGELLSIPRILFAGARDGLMPRPMAKVHPRFFTPYVAIAVYALFGIFFSIFGAFRQLAILSSAALLLIYLGVVLSTLPRRKKEAPLALSAVLTDNSAEDAGKIFQVPGGPLIPLLAAGGICWLLSNLSKEEFTGGAIFIALFSGIYLLTGYLKKKALIPSDTRKPEKIVELEIISQPEIVNKKEE